MRRAIILGLVLNACGGDSQVDPTEYAQLTVPPFPEDVRHAAMRMFPDDTTGLALSLVFDRGGQMLWLTAPQSDGETRRVLAVLRIPEVADDVSLVFRPGACTIDGVVDPEIVAFARFVYEPVLADVTHAWRADRASSRLVAQPPEGVACANDRYTQ